MSLGINTRITNTREQTFTFSRGKTLYVGGDGPGNYTKIQDAIDNSSDGDTVFVYDDSSPYFENLVIDKSINLIGQNRDTTIIDGSESGDVVNISVDRVNISSFTIQNSGDYDDGINILSNSNTITGNNISNNWHGIDLYSSNSNTITGNTISNNEDGIYLDDSDSNTITGNTISNNNYGIYLRYSDSNTITSNTISSNNNCGIWLYSSSNNNIVSGNTISNHYIGRGITLWGFPSPSRNNIISGNNISNNYHGILFHISSANTIMSNTISNNEIAIYLLHSSSNTITGNNILNNNYSILLYKSSVNTITGNNISGNEYGIWLKEASNNTFTGNNISNNINGIYFRGFSNYNTIKGNNITFNNKYGVYVCCLSGNNIFTSNNIASNNECGMYITGSFSNDNFIYHNNFINIGENAFDKCNNTWDDGKYGNYWSDYKERYPFAFRSLLKPWMWNTPYEIEGGDNKDRCPLVNQWPNSLSRTMPRNRAFRFIDMFSILQALLFLKK